MRTLAGVVGDGVEHVVALAQRHLGMDGAFLAAFEEGQEVFGKVAGDGESSD